MQFDVPDRWILLDLILVDGVLSVGYHDDRHRVRPPIDAPQPLPLGDSTLARYVTSAALPEGFGELLDQQISDLTAERTGPHAGRPVPLPVFLSVPPLLADVQWEDLGRVLAQSWAIGSERIQIVRLARRKWRRRPTLKLPLRIIGLGAHSTRALAGFREHKWLFTAYVPEYGLEIQTTDSGALTAEPVINWDIVVADSSSANVVLRSDTVRRRRAANPRLVVLIDQEADSQLKETLPAGVSLLTIESPSPQGFISEFLFGIVHDYPLHEAVKSAWETAGKTLRHPPRLYADPASNQDLRISDAFVAMVREAKEIETVALPGDVSGFLSRVGPEAPSALHGSLHRAAEIGRSVEAELNVLNLPTDFRREGTGLVPMAQAAASLSRAQKNVRLLGQALRNSEPWIRPAMMRHQQRRVDIALERQEYSPILSAGIPIQEAVWVDRRTVLRRGARYHLTVRIGRRFATSLIGAKLPAIDPLLPGGGAHQLEVVVYGLDFAVIGRHARVFLLPELGASPLISFAVRAPERDGGARLRVGVYHENHIVQSFLLQALIDQEERSADRDVLVVTLELSRSARFTNLEQLRPRALSVGINQSPTGTHSLMIKHDGQAQAFSFQWQTVDQKLKDFRRLLTSATTAPGGMPRYPVGTTSESGSREAFEQTVRDLATLGKGLYDGLWQRARSLEKTLRALARTLDKPIQIVRFDVNNVLPWSIMYDYPLPRTIVGEQPAGICLGGGEGVEPGDPPAKQCDHGPGHPGFCIYGFWGVRHVIEELLVAADANGDTEPCLHITRNSLQESVWLSVDQDDASTQELRSHLDRALGAGVLRQLGPGEDLIGLLWHTDQRPELLIVLGHLEVRAIPGEPQGARIVLPGRAWLQPEAITQRTQDDGRWGDEPHALTLLMACGSGATDATTLNDFVLALTDAGASAVVGTETTIFSGLAAFFARDIASRMWKPEGASVGVAIKDFRRRLMTHRNPLGFVFSSFGSADVTVES